MARYLATYRGMSHVDPSQMAQTKQAFGKWIAEAGDAVIDPGAPTNTLAHVSQGAPTTTEIGGYSIIEAGPVAKAVKPLESHPFVGRGGTLQVNEPLRG